MLVEMESDGDSSVTWVLPSEESHRTRRVSFVEFDDDDEDDDNVFTTKPVAAPAAALAAFSTSYERVLWVLGRPAGSRAVEDVRTVMPWFRNKMKLFEMLQEEPLLELLTHAQLDTAFKGQMLVRQGDKGSDFFVVLCGQVTVLMKDLLEDIDDHDSDRSSLGNVVDVLGAGKSFGELALLAEDNLRAASVVADERTDVLVVPRDLYNRTVAHIVNQEYEEKLGFVNTHSFFRNWTLRWKRTLAINLSRAAYKYEQVLVRQGEKADNVYFIVSGEVKLSAEPDGHKETFSRFMDECTNLLNDDEDENLAQKYYALSKYMSPTSRRAKRLRSAPNTKDDGAPCESADLFKPHVSPSTQRRMQDAARPKYNLCFLEPGQALGDIELLVGLDTYHASAVCTMDTQVLALHRMNFEKLFRKKNPATIKIMTRHLSLNIPNRMSRPDLAQNVPLLKYIVLKLQELTGERRMRKKLKDEDFSLPHMDLSDSSTIFSRAKSIKTNRTFPLMSHQSPRFRHNFEPIQMPQLPKAANHTLQFVSQSYIPDDSHGLNAGPSVIFNEMATKNTTADKPKEEDAVVEKKPKARDGIFVKLMQMSYPGIERRHMNVSEEEYNYLTQLKKRMSKHLKDFYPYKSSEHILGISSNTTSKPPRLGLTPRGGGGKTFPIISPKSARRTVGKNDKGKENVTKNVNFSLPKFQK